MTERTCSNCQHWADRESADFSGFRPCKATPNEWCIPQGWDGLPVPMLTQPGFGCRLHLQVVVMGESTLQ